MADSISRRGFLAASTAAATAATLAPAAARTRPTPLTDRDFWYLHKGGVFGDHSFASERPEDLRGKTVGRRRRFMPRPTESRFVVFIGEWLDERMDDLEPRDPTSWVDVPYLEGQSGEPACDLEWCTRELGLARVAEINRGLDGVDGAWFSSDWAMLLEYGELIRETSFRSLMIGRSGVVIDHQNRDYPARVVIPTVEELARYAIDVR